MNGDKRMQNENQGKPAANDEDQLDLLDKVRLDQERLKSHPGETDVARDYRLRLKRMSEFHYLGKARDDEPQPKRPEVKKAFSQSESDRLLVGRLLKLSKKHYGIE
jgi:hypothetical protein